MNLFDNVEKKEHTNNRVLRIIGNASGAIGHFAILKCVRNENKNRLKRAKLWERVFRVFDKPCSWWGTFYVLKK